MPNARRVSKRSCSSISEAMLTPSRVTIGVPIPGTHAITHGLELEAEKSTGRRKRLSTVLVRSAPPHEDTPDSDQEDDNDR